MKIPHLPVVLLVLLLAFNLHTNVAMAGDEWSPVEPSLLEQKTPIVEKDADAEAVFWVVRVDDQNDGDPRSAFTNYLRIKIFTERGVEAQSKVELTYLVNSYEPLKRAFDALYEQDNHTITLKQSSAVLTN